MRNRERNFKGRPTSEIGKVVDQRATFDDEGNVITPPQFKPGHWVVTIGQEPEWSDYLQDMTGETPPRVFFGRERDTYVYKFPSEAAFLALFPEEEEQQEE